MFEVLEEDEEDKSVIDEPEMLNDQDIYELMNNFEGLPYTNTVAFLLRSSNNVTDY